MAAQVAQQRAVQPLAVANREVGPHVPGLAHAGDDRAHRGIGQDEPQRELGGAWLVAGSFPVDQLPDLFSEPVELDSGYEATTLGGLVSEVEGRIPLRGEVVMLDHTGIRIEVVASTDRRVEQLFATGRAMRRPSRAAAVLAGVTGHSSVHATDGSGYSR